MSSGTSQRAALLALLGRRLAGEQAITTVLFHQAIAERLGLNTTDLMCLSILSDAEQLTAGQLADATGLTTGSVTVMIDRLEKAGYAQRDKDPTDRRRVLVRPQTERIEREIAPLYASLGAAWEHAIEHYSTDDLAVILDMLTRSVVLLHEQTAALRLEGAPNVAPVDVPRAAARSADAGQPPPSGPPERRTQHMRLLFANGASAVTMRGAALRELYQAHFEPPEPQVRLQGGAVHIQYPRRSLFQQRRGNGTIVLNADTHWQIELRGGAYQCSFDLRAVLLTQLAVFDGASRLELNLGPPHGIVPIRLAGGAVDITIRRPAETATQLVVRVGATRLRLDKHYADVASDETRWETPNAAAAADRYEVTVEGGASNLRVVS